MSDAPELTPVRDHHRFDEAALSAYMSENMEGDFGNLDVLQFEGGQSNPTFLIQAGGDSFVMRKKPPGTLLKSAHAVDREYRIMTALRDTNVPVPRTYVLCEDESVIGTAFFVMENVEGRVIPAVELPGFTREERIALYQDFAKVLAALHSVDLKSVGLEGYGREGNYFARQISRWSKQYTASQTEDLPAMNSLMAWLVDNTPEMDESTIVHGDYRIGNCIIHPTEPKIAALLDWELSTTGHPFGDLGYCCMGYHLRRADLVAFPEPGSGVPTEQEFLDMYCKAAGRGEIENWNFYISFNLFRSAAIVQGVYKRGLDGNAASEHWRGRDEDCKRASICGWELAQQIGA